MKYKTREEVEIRINENYECVQELEKMIEAMQDDLEKLELITLIGWMYSQYVTGVYSNYKLEHIISKIGEKNIHIDNNIVVKKNTVLIVMTSASYIGGHTVLVHNWIKWDDKVQYSIVFTEANSLDIPEFLRDIVKKSGGKIEYLVGNCIEKAEKLGQISLKYERILLLVRMNDVVPGLVYGNTKWKLPVYFYNHADFKFSYSFSCSDVIMNLCQFDVDKSIRYRGVPKEKSIYIQFPGAGVLENNKKNLLNKDECRKKINKQYKLNHKYKLVVSMGADYKYENVIGYEFDQYVKKLFIDCSEDIYFLIIGADKENKKWIDLENNTNGKAKALGVLQREEAEWLICAADLFIASFPMIASGCGLAELYRVPWLCLNVTGRISEDAEDIRIANSIDELIEKTIDILCGNKNKYLDIICESNWSQVEWKEKWNVIKNQFSVHEGQKITPHRYVEKHEIINCQLLQESAGKSVNMYFSSRHLPTLIRKKLYELDKKYDMGIYPENCFEEYNLAVNSSIKYYSLYKIAIKWITIKQSSKSIEQYLLSKRYTRIAIYGMGYLGMALAEELLHSKVELKYGIDKNAGNLKHHIKIYNPAEFLDEVDLIINTTAIGNDFIIDGMVMKNIKMIQLENLLNEVEREDIY